MKEIGASMDRCKRFERELRRADPAMRAQLLGAWKEALLERAARLLKTTDDPEFISFLDTNLAVIEEIGARRCAAAPE